MKKVSVVVPQSLALTQFSLFYLQFEIVIVLDQSERGALGLRALKGPEDIHHGMARTILSDTDTIDFVNRLDVINFGNEFRAYYSGPRPSQEKPWQEGLATLNHLPTFFLPTANEELFPSKLMGSLHTRFNLHLRTRLQTMQTNQAWKDAKHRFPANSEIDYQRDRNAPSFFTTMLPENWASRWMFPYQSERPYFGRLPFTLSVLFSNA